MRVALYSAAFSFHRSVAQNDSPTFWPTSWPGTAIK